MRRYLFTLCLFVSFILSSCTETPPTPPPSSVYNCIPATGENLTQPTFEISSSFPEEVFQEFRQGQTGSLSVDLKLKDPDGVVCDAVVFMNVVEFIKFDPNPPQVTHLLFDTTVAKQVPTLMNVVHAGERLSAGVGTKLSFKFKDNAPLGKYAIVFQVVNGSETNPSAVNPANKIFQQRYLFELKAR